jgi:hypothetical protein
MQFPSVEMSPRRKGFGLSFQSNHPMPEEKARELANAIIPNLGR